MSQYIIMAMELIKASIDKVTDKNTTERQKYLMYRKLGIKVPMDKVKHVMITIQFHDEKVEDYPGLMPRILNLKWLKHNEYWYTYEYHSKQYPDGGNLHTHLLVKQVDDILNKSKILRDINRRFKEELKVVNYQHSSSKEYFANRLAYVRGEKSTKEEFVQKDRVWKNENNILPYYTNADETHEKAESLSPTQGL